MNEPDITVALVVLAALLAMPFLHAVVLAVCARWGATGVWTAWAAGFGLFAAVAWLLSMNVSLHAEDTKLFARLILGTGAATACAAWVVDRRRRSSSASTWELAGYAVPTAIVGMIAVLAVSC